MKVVWEFELEFENITKIEMPVGAEILTVQRDEKTNKPCLWAVVETEAEDETRCFELFGTGQCFEPKISSNRIYIGTYQYQKGAFVGHVFEYKGI